MITHHFDIEPKQPCQLPSAQLLHASIHHGALSPHCDVHSHIFTELLYVLQGSGWIEVDGQRVELQTGDVLVLNPQCPHHGIQPEREPFSTLSLDLCCSCCVGGQGAGWLQLTGRETALLEPYLRLFLQELQSRRDYFEPACHQLTALLMLQINRICPLTQNNTSSSRKSAMECARVRQYIDEHYAESITLDQLARYAGLNKYYLVHVFNREMGCSPISYLIERRISESKRLLAATRIPVQQISRQLGFSSPSYFSQSFRRATGVSPAEFRRQALSMSTQPTE